MRQWTQKSTEPDRVQRQTHTDTVKVKSVEDRGVCQGSAVGRGDPRQGLTSGEGGPRYHGYHELSPEKLSGLCPLMAKKRHIGIPAGPLGSGTHTDLPHSASTASCSSGTGVVPPWKGRQRVSVSCGVASTSPSLQKGALSWEGEAVT